MDDAKHFRGQAELCLQIALQMSDPQVVANLKLEAARYMAMADLIEARGQAKPQAGPGPN